MPRFDIGEDTLDRDSVGIYSGEITEEQLMAKGYCKVERIWSELHDIITDENIVNTLCDYRMKLRKEFDPAYTQSCKEQKG